MLKKIRSLLTRVTGYFKTTPVDDWELFDRDAQCSTNVLSFSTEWRDSEEASATFDFKTVAPKKVGRKPTVSTGNEADVKLAAKKSAPKAKAKSAAAKAEKKARTPAIKKDSK